MKLPILVTLVSGCSGWVGDIGFLECPEVPLGDVMLDETLPTLQRSVRDLPVFAASPLRTRIAYADGRTTGVSVRVEPLSATVQTRSADELAFAEGGESCHEVVTQYRIEAFTDDGAFSWSNTNLVSLVSEEDAEQLLVSVPFHANLGDHILEVNDWTKAFLEAHPEVAPESVKPLVYELALDLSEPILSGSLTLITTHDPVSQERDGRILVSTSTEWSVATF
ncbi:MAG: hypothetical protein AAGA48_02050 [Myxococcota bacterium]